MYTRIYKKAFAALVCILSLVCAFPASAKAAQRLQDTGDKLVIVIDPGHGGSNRGTISGEQEEKGMTLTTAQAMYDELCLYEGVEVYMTRTGDKELSLKQRAEFAAEKEADIMFSIHYNASEYHTHFGSEVWVSAFVPFNAYGYQFGQEVLKEFRETGLFIRGIKTRIGDDNLDYYGIIREAYLLNIPSLIIEHCYVDEERDIDYCATEEDMKAFGKADATAVAKYFGLKSSALQVDYSDYELAEADISKIQPLTRIDDTAPDICQLEWTEADYEKGLLTLTVNAVDYDSALIYYEYSLDGGKTFSRREIWPQSDTLTGTSPDTVTLNLKVPMNTKPSVVVRVHNMYDLYTESNLCVSPEAFTADVEQAVSAVPEVTEASPEPTEEPKTEEITFTKEPVSALEQETTPAGSDSVEEPEVSFMVFLEICLVIVAVLFILLFVSQLIARKKKRRKR